MKRFAQLFTEIDATTRTTEKVEAMSRYFTSANPGDAAWAVYFLSGGRPKRLVPVRRLADWAMEESGVYDWLFEESYHAVGDLAETIALLLPDSSSSSDEPLHVWVERKLLRIGTVGEEEQKAIVLEAWRSLALRAYDRAALSCLLKVGLSAAWFWAAPTIVPAPFFQLVGLGIFMAWVIGLVSAWRLATDAHHLRQRLGIDLRRRSARA